MKCCTEQYCKIWDLRCDVGPVSGGSFLHKRSWSFRKENLAKGAVKRTHSKGEKALIKHKIKILENNINQYIKEDEKKECFVFVQMLSACNK